MHYCERSTLTPKALALLAGLAFVGFGSAAILAKVWQIDALAKVIFGVFSFMGTSQASLLPLALFQREWSRSSTYEPVGIAGVLTAIGYSGLYAFSEANLLNYSLPAIFVTWLFANKVIREQGLDVSIRNSNLTGKSWTWSVLSIYNHST